MFRGYKRHLAIRFSRFAAMLALFLPLAGQAALINGGFETNSFSGWTLGGDTQYVSVCATGATFYVTGLLCSSHTGTYAAGLGNSTSNGTLSQTMATAAGSLYSLTFYMRNDNYSQAANNLFQVSWNGATIYSVANLANAGYMQLSFTGLKATTNSTTLTFTYKNVPGAFFIDDVSVTPASEPATLAIAGSGLIAIWVMGSRLRLRTARAASPGCQPDSISEFPAAASDHSPEHF